jgi:alginate O-acetyltransferase complex protein AlgI
MQYVSLLYLLGFLPTVLLLYLLLPQRHRWKLLLAASYVFFFLLSRKLIVYLLVSTISIHGIGLWLSRCDDDLARREAEGADAAEAKRSCAASKKHVLCYGATVHVGLLLLLKYFNFFGENINFILAKLPGSFQIPALSLAVPIGISFFTLQAVSYIADVYHNRVRGDESLGRLALYMAFFPSIMEGPICRYSQTAADLYAGRPLQYDNVAFGIQRIFWGLFKKLVIADRLNLLVFTIFNHYEDYGGVTVALGAMLYTLQLYADFSGCIDVSIGTAQMFGVTLPENFRQPFFSRTASEFWRRWHITLGTFFKDYIFYPLSLSHFAKSVGKRARKKFGRHLGQVAQTVLPLSAVWLCNGLWHGVGWHYIFFGLYYFVLILAGNLLEPAAKKTAELLHLNRNGIPWRTMQAFKMAAIIFTGELFFRANGLHAGFSMLKSIFTKWNISVLFDGSLLKLGIDGNDFAAVAVGTVIVLIVGIMHEKGVHIRSRVAGMALPLRWTIYIAAILAVVVFGAYGDGYLPVDPLYAGF